MKKSIHGGDIYRHRNAIDYSSNCNPFGTPEGVRQAIRQAADQVSCYPDVRCSRLRSLLAEKLQVPEEKIFFGNGAAEIFFAVCQACRPKQALIPAPSFAEYAQAAEAAGCQVLRYFTEEAQGFRITEKICEEITEDLDMLFLCNPNNPTGTFLEETQMEAILNRARKKNVKVVLDECFMDFIAAEKQYTWLRRLAEYTNVIVVRAFTKLYAMAGVRLGYAVTWDEKIIGRLEDFVQPWNVSVIAQEAGAAALAEEEYVKKTLEEIEIEKVLFRRELEKTGVKVYDSEANYLFFRGDVQLYEKMLEKGYLLRDCSNYPGLGAGFFRAAVKRHEENAGFIEAMKEIQREAR